MTKVLPIIHWNDVYKVTPQKVSSTETIDVTQFATLLNSIRDQWTQRSDGKKEGLVLFSGDVFSPSVESSVTRGSHMVPVMNELAPDVSLVGNHDFDFGYPHLSKLVKDTTFPWLLSNIIDTTTGRVPQGLHEFQVLERGGIRIGVIGLVEKEWIGTVSSWPPTFEYRDMEVTGKNLSKCLRDPKGEHKCDLIVALTHSRLPNDISLARSLLALSPAAHKKTPIIASHGADILLGGHDHLYFVAKGVSSWENFDITMEVLGAEDDRGDILLVKSGCDFRDLSELTLELDSTPPGSVRNKVVKSIKGKRHSTKPGSKSCERLSKILATILSSVSSTINAPVCKSTTVIDVRSGLIRTEESAAGNWFADVIRHAYDDALLMKGNGGADGVLICAGTLRGDSIYGPGMITLGDILEILPFEDPLVVLEVDGEALWRSLESSLETWPAQEGRFPVISGFRVSWDSRRPPGRRVLGVWLVNEVKDNENTGDGGKSTPRHEDGEEIQCVRGRKFKIVTREYMAQGHDGFLPLKGQKYLIDDESGQLMSSIVRKYLMGSLFVNKMARLANHSTIDLHPDTWGTISREKAREAHRVADRWKNAARLALHWSRSKAHYQDNLSITAREHMSGVDCFDGQKTRSGKETDPADESDEDLPTISPEVDGRLRDKGRDTM